MAPTLVAAPLPRFADLAEAQAYAARMFAADAVVPFQPVFTELPFGPVAVYSDGSARLAEYVSTGAGVPAIVVP